MAERRAKLDTFSMNVYPYSQNHVQNWLFEAPYGVSGEIYALYLKILTQRNLVTEFHRKNISFTSKTAN